MGFKMYISFDDFFFLSLKILVLLKFCWTVGAIKYDLAYV